MRLEIAMNNVRTMQEIHARSCVYGHPSQQLPTERYVRIVQYLPKRSFGHVLSDDANVGPFGTRTHKCQYIRMANAPVIRSTLAPHPDLVTNFFNSAAIAGK